MGTTNHFFFSAHAVRRIAQRGIQSEALRLLLDYGESFNAGQHCSYYQVSKATLRRLANTGVREQILRTAACLQAVISEQGEVLTCYRANARRLASSRRRPSHKYN